MAQVTMRDLLEAGVHFGHQTNRWNPKMRPFIYGARNGIHIVDLSQTVRMFAKAYEFVVNTVAKGQSVMFVGTKKQAQDTVKEQADRANQYYVVNRWLGGTLTNFQTIGKSVEKLKGLDRQAKDGTLDKYTKKERLMIMRERERLENNVGGIKFMKKIPGAMFVIDPKKEEIAIKEANKLGIPVIAVCDTNCDPDGIDYVIPGNDDAIRAIRLFSGSIAEACLEGAKLAQSRRNDSAREAAKGDQSYSAGGRTNEPEVVSRGTGAEEADKKNADKA